MKKSDYSVNAKLIQQTPIIHFQHNQTGVCLRASEVKPKLDKFLAKRGANATWKSDKDAYDYKMTLAAVGPQEELEPPAMYYGNMGSGEKVKCIKGNCSLEIICFIPELLDFICRNLEEFFIVTNFGRMSDKGFGVYVLEESMKRRPEEIGEILARDAEAANCYYFEGYREGDFFSNVEQYTDKNGRERTKITCQGFDDIKTVYSVMKSGVNISTPRGDNYQRSYLFKYCHDEMKNLGNEKCKMKKDGVSPVVGKNYEGKDHNESDYRYVRAMLGIGDHIDYIADVNDKRNKESISISNSDIARYNSPIQFVVINNIVYFVAHRILPEVMGRKFEFENTKTKKKVTIETPDEFDIDGFMEYFHKHYNADAKDAGRSLCYMSQVNNSARLIKKVERRG